MKATRSSAVPGKILVVISWVAGCIAPAFPTTTESRSASPAGGGGSVILEPVPEPRSSRKQRTVFVCEHDAAPIFSDRPCGQVMETLEIDVAEPGPGRAASTLRAEPEAETRPLVQRTNHDIEPPPVDDRCESLERQLEALDDRMRTGYSARESARLWNRWRDLKAQIHASRC